MPFEPLRFIHAAGLLVDHQLRDVPPLPPAAREIVENATVSAFERVISAAIERNVDFVLLAGDCFDAADNSLRALVLLRRTLELLAEHDVRVFVVPGAADPRAAWRAMKNLPDNVTTLLEPNDDPVAVIRDGKVIASVTSIDLRSLRGRNKDEAQTISDADAHRGPLKIGLLVLDEKITTPSTADATGADGPRVDCEGAADAECGLPKLLAGCRLDYLALGGHGTRCMIAMRTGVAHHPGGTQAILESGTGPRGATLVEIDQAGAVRSTFLPTATVRRETFSFRVDPDTTRHQLIAKFRDALEDCRAEPGELVWLLNWTVRGTGPMRDALLDEQQRNALLEAAELAASAGLQPQMFHTFQFVPDAPAIETPTRNEVLLLDFLSTLDESAPASRAAAAACFAAERPTNPVWARTLELLMREIDGELVAAEARQLGTSWLAPVADEGPAL